MRNIGNEMDDATSFMSCLSAGDSFEKVLDLCMAPGGFSNAIQRRHNAAQISGLSLPLSLGGHPLLLERSNPALRVRFADITMLSSEMGVSAIPPDHPDVANFSQDRPYIGESFDLVICDGQVLRTHPRQPYRTELEACRLTMSQLVLALQRIKIGGTLVMLLHKLDYWDSVQLLYMFSRFSDMQLFKSENHHAIRSSFYLVATNVQPKIPAATAAIETWKRVWSSATFDFRREETTAEEAAICLSWFGETLIRLGKPIWTIQLEALRGAHFMKGSKMRLRRDGV